MKIRNVFASLLLLGLSFSFAGAPVADKNAKPVTEMKDGKAIQFAYDMPLVGITDPGMMLGNLSQRNLLVFYFSAKCPHCMRTYPEIQKLMDRFESLGLAGVAIATGSNKKRDIRTFIENQQVSIPVFQDAEQQFSRNYGTGYVPLILLVAEDGSYIRFTNHSPEMLEYLASLLEKRLQAESN